MVSLIVSTPGKPTVNLDFPAKHPDGVTVGELKSAIATKFPKVRPFVSHLSLDLISNPGLIFRSAGSLVEEAAAGQNLTMCTASTQPPTNHLPQRVGQAHAVDRG